MIPAIVLFAVTYVLILVFGKYRTYIALASGVLFVLTGMLPVSELFSAIDFNNMDKEEIRECFIEFKKEDWPYQDCMHLKEKECRIKEEVKKIKFDY